MKKPKNKRLEEMRKEYAEIEVKIDAAIRNKKITNWTLLRQKQLQLRMKIDAQAQLQKAPKPVCIVERSIPAY